MSYVKGEVTYKIYYNESNEYGVYKVDIESTDEPEFDFHKTCTVTGYFRQLEIGANYCFNGKIIFHNKYGNTFVCDTYERLLPTSKEGLIDFLSGSMFYGIGRKTAEEIVETIGENCLEKIIENKDILDDVKGMSKIKKETIYQTLIENREIENTLVTLYSYGLTPNMSMRIFDRYGTGSLDVIKENPYKLIDDIEGIAFIKADKIALSVGFNEKSESRIEACISYSLMNDANETGNTFLEKDELFARVKNYLGFGREDEELISNSIENLKFKGKLIETNNTYSDYRLHYAERYISTKLKQLRDEPKNQFNEEEIYSLLSNLEDRLDIKYEDEQKMAIYRALTNNVSIITGGPGTGKTTIERGIIYCYNQLVEKDKELIKLCAPTGRAAKRIEESTSYRATTIHKLLAYDSTGNFGYNKFNPLVAKIIVIDEASMVDSFLFEHLLEALPIDTKVVIVGDADQLPSIGPGQVLKDLIDSKCFESTKLYKIHRQKENSKIISLAYDILDEEIKTELDESHDELAFIESRPEDLNNILKNTIDHFVSHGYSLQNDIQVLAPIYKGSVGIDAINHFMQMTYNSSYNFENQDEVNKYYLDDKVIQLVNQYEDSVMNGDMGIVDDILGEKEIIVDYQGNRVSYKGQDIGNIKLAYSISIHKSQGSEFPVVILPVFPQYRLMLNKKLLYTAVTRAKEHLVLIGSMRTINNSIKILSENRKTRLRKFLEES